MQRSMKYPEDAPESYMDSDFDDDDDDNYYASVARTTTLVPSMYPGTDLFRSGGTATMVESDSDDDPYYSAAESDSDDLDDFLVQTLHEYGVVTAWSNPEYSSDSDEPDHPPLDLDYAWGNPEYSSDSDSSDSDEPDHPPLDLTDPLDLDYALGNPEYSSDSDEPDHPPLDLTDPLAEARRKRVRVQARQDIAAILAQLDEQEKMYAHITDLIAPT